MRLVSCILPQIIKEQQMLLEVLPKLYQIVVPTPFAVGPVNCYVATTDPVTLIDTGPLHADSRTALHAGLSELGLHVLSYPPL